MMGSAEQLLESVVDSGLCIGCGACTAIEGSPLRMRMNRLGRYEPVQEGREDRSQGGALLRVCPFADAANEDALAEIHLEPATADKDRRLGAFRALGAGYARDESLRSNGSSGGMTTWFVSKLIEQGLVDAVLHVKEDVGSHPLFSYAVSKSIPEAQGRAKTRYYPVEMGAVLGHVRENPGKYAVVGVPCFIKAIRLLQQEDAIFADRVHYCVGLVCGHLKSSQFAEALAWELGVKPTELASIDFRVKNSTSADAYDVLASSSAGRRHVGRASTLLVSDWGQGMFKYRACDYCDDVTAETADVSFGDAWLPQFTGDPAGTNVVITRSERALRVFDANSREVQMVDLSADQVAQSQAAGIRHRREGLAFRLARAADNGDYVPSKRVAELPDLEPHRALIYTIRSEFIGLADAAFAEAKVRGNFRYFRRAVKAKQREYERAYASGLSLKERLRLRHPRVMKAFSRLKRLF